MEARGERRLSRKGRTAAGERPGAFAPGGLLSVALVVLLGLHVPLGMALACAWAWRLEVLRRMGDGGTAGVPGAEGSMVLLGVLSLCQVALILPTIPVFLAWYRRVYRNLLWWGVDRLGESTLWALGSFFVPFAGYIVPYLVMQETWRGSDPSVDMESSHAWRKGPRSPWIVGWWAAWVAWNLVGGVVLVLVKSLSKGVPAARRGAGVEVVAEALYGLAAALAIAVVLTVDRRQSAKVRQVAELRTQAPATDAEAP